MYHWPRLSGALIDVKMTLLMVYVILSATSYKHCLTSHMPGVSSNDNKQDPQQQQLLQQQQQKGPLVRSPLTVSVGRSTYIQPDHLDLRAVLTSTQATSRPTRQTADSTTSSTQCKVKVVTDDPTYLRVGKIQPQVSLLLTLKFLKGLI